MRTLADYYIERNVGLLRQWKKLLAEGYKTREATKIISETNEKVSPGLIHALVWNKEYAYAAEAWAIIDKEEEEKEAS